jgi:hypothetical protein
VESGFGQRDGDSEVGWGFVVENSTNAVVADSEYEIVAYDAAGTVLETDSSYIDFVLPGERLGIGGSLYLADGTVVERLEFSLQPGNEVQLSGALPFTTQRATYLPSDSFASVSGIVSNPTERLQTDVYAWAVLYDASGKIIGGGFTFLQVVPAGGSVPVEALVASSVEPERVELYAALSSFSVNADVAGLNDASQALDVIKYGWSETGDFGEVGWGFLLRNPLPDRIAEDISYVVAAYADDGTILRVTSSFLSVLLPGETLGVGGSFFIDVTTPPTSIEVQAFSRGSSASGLQTIFTTEDVALVSDEFGWTVTGTIRSSHTSDLDGIEVYAVCYNAAGDIIGGGFTFAGLVPAGGTADAEVSVAVAEAPATVELYATVSTFSGSLE